MERVKDLSKGILRGDGLFVEIIEKENKSGLILPDSASTDIASYIRVLAVGNKVEDIEPGDIILDVGSEVATFVVEEKRYAMIFRGSVLFAVKPDNFDVDYKEVSGGDINV